MEYIDIDDIPDNRMDRLYWVECDYCDGTGLVVDNATEEAVECPRCDGLAVLSAEGPGLEEYEPGDDDDDAA
jgi:DnaJ-class molecular chaperone